MKFYLPASCSTDAFTFFGIVSAGPMTRKYLLKQRDLFGELQSKLDCTSLYQLVYWDNECEWYETENVAEADLARLNALIGASGVLRLPDDFEMSGATQQSRMECDRMCVSERGVHWCAYPKHTDVRVETDMLRWEDLRDDGHQHDQSSVQGSGEEG